MLIGTVPVMPTQLPHCRCTLGQSERLSPVPLLLALLCAIGAAPADARLPLCARQHGAVRSRAGSAASLLLPAALLRGSFRRFLRCPRCLLSRIHIDALIPEVLV